MPPTDDHVPPRPKGGGTETHYCAYDNGTIGQSTTVCDPKDNGTCTTITTATEKCHPIDPDKSNHCVHLWHYNPENNTATIRFKGCFLDTVACRDRTSSCRIHKSKLLLLTCCCEGDMCNANVTFPGLEADIEDATDLPTQRIPPDMQPISNDDSRAVIAYILTPLFVLFLALVGCYLLYRRRKGTSFAELGNAEGSLSRPPSANAGMDNEAADLVGLVTLCEVRARGRFGAVWRAKLGQRDVAVKVFPLQDKQSWLAEQEIYKLPRMDHPDILHYIGVDKKGDNLQAEYWLITAYHEKVRFNIIYYY